jgi:cysteinyl-tRNA synthetase
MSKSLGNFLLIKDFLKEYHPEVLRLFFLSAHYRNPIDYTDRAVDNADAALQRLYTTLERVSEVQGAEGASPKGNGEIEEFEAGFHAAMEDDFNTALALASVFDLATAINRMIDEGDPSALPYIVQGRNLLVALARLLGLLNDDVAAFMRYESHRHLTRAGITEAGIEEAIKSRSDARLAKDFKKADEIRNGLLEKGILLLDSPQGTKWRIKK